MAGQRLETIIAINAEVGNGFAKVGSTLSQLGSLVDGMSQKLIDFGTESVDVYRKYELSMADAQVALSTIYGRNTRELSGVMKELDVAATEWAATTIFHTDDVANAIAEAAHAGWDLDQIMAGIPASMELAQAGGLDLSEAVDYIVKTANAAGLEFEDLDSLIDHWAFTANSSATDIGELGDAMLRMGATMKFAGGTDELLTMLAVLADAGTVGSDAGTLLRNSMLRLVAPTKKASEMMDQLGATSEELDEIASDSALTEANETLEQVGFSAYDSQGNLKDMLTIFRDLSGALDQIGSEDERNKVLSSIFPTRSITGAMALIEAATEDYNGLYEALKGGDAEGYGEYASSTMMDTLNGSIETFQSKLENLKKEVGAELAPWLQDLAASFGGIVDSIAGMDDTSFSILIDGLKGLALLGPGLLFAGGAMRAVGTAFAAFSSPAGLAAGTIIAASFAIGMFVDAANKLEEANFKDKFGTLELDMSQVNAYVEELKQAFDAGQEEITQFQSEIDAAVSNYQNASETLKSELLIKNITNAELTEADKSKFYNLGDEMASEVKRGIDASYAELITSLTQAYGGEGAAEDNPVWNELVSVALEGHDADIEQAESLGRRLKDALTKAFKEGLSAENIADVQKVFNEMNELMARQEDERHYVEMAKLKQKAQTLGLDAIEQASALYEDERNRELETLAGTQARAYYKEKAAWDAKIAAADTEEMRNALTARRDAALADLDERHATQLRQQGAIANKSIFDLMESGIMDSDLANTWGILGQAAQALEQSGGVLTPQAAQAFNEAISGISSHDQLQAGRYIDSMIENLGGFGTVQDYADFFAGIGDTASASRYNMLMAASQMLAMGGRAGMTGLGTYGDTDLYGTISGMLSGYNRTETPEDLVSMLSSYSQDLGGSVSDVVWDQLIGPAAGAIAGLGRNMGLSDEGGDLVSQVIQSLSDQHPEIVPEIVQPEGLEPQEMEVTPVVPEDVDMPPVEIPATIEPDELAANMKAQGIDQASVQVDGDTERLVAKIDAEDQQTLLEFVDGDITDLHGSIISEDGQIITTFVDGNTQRLREAIAAIGNQTVYVNVAARGLLPGLGGGGFAEGGRAVIPSIFGEAGPEWAIPEEHTNRTAELLNAAREASGFTWPELLAKFGGLNADSNHTPSTLIYSPTIQATDVTGVERALLEDKARLEKWWTDRQIREEMEVYA